MKSIGPSGRAGRFRCRAHAGSGGSRDTKARFLNPTRHKMAELAEDRERREARQDPHKPGALRSRNREIAANSTFWYCIEQEEIFPTQLRRMCERRRSPSRHAAENWPICDSADTIPATRMADWKQITARIRRARTSKDPAGQLANLYEKTHDAMVAFELAKYFETSGQTADAAKWYGTAAEHFRRADWKTKAQEAAARLGEAPPSESNAGPADQEAVLTSPPIVVPEPGLPFEQNAAALESMMAVSSEIQSASESAPSTSAAGAATGRRRRGRRGGRNRRRAPAEGGATFGAAATPASSASGAHGKPASRGRDQESPEPSDSAPRRAIPSFPVEPMGERAEPGVKGRFGDPGLASRSSLLEMQLRRLLTCPPAKLDQADKAPAGPGVLVLTDDEMTTYYYVEACDTLRVAIGYLTRGGAGRRGNPLLKPQLAEHLGIAETRVGKYLTDHCVVRWLQLDDGAPYFAHYAIALLRPILNE